MDSSIKSVIKIQKGNEYHVFVDNAENMYNENAFFYPVYKKSVQLLGEICLHSKKDGDVNDFFSNNIIMYCAERGGGKSSAMRSFANFLNQFEAEKEKRCFSNSVLHDIEKFKFSVLKIIDPTAISSKDLFMRIILSRMFSVLRSKIEKEGKDFLPQDANRQDSLVSKFMECYRLLDVIYQKGGEFSCDDDLEELSDLGDSCKLREKFSDLVQHYLRVFIGEKNCENNFLVIQIDDADLNSQMAFNIIEDIRKYCIIPNVVILMAVNMDQMRCVIEQYFVTSFKPMLDVSSLTLSECQKMAARYIDKIMPAGHQIHLPTIDDYIQNRSSELTIEYFEKGDNNEKNLLSYPDTKNKVLTDYQEVLIRLIYEKTGIPLVKASGYLHNILPKTMRGLCHFLAYMEPLESLNKDYGVSEINVFCNRADDAKKITDEGTKTVEDAEKELAKRKRNLDALEQYFLKNWCPIRLSHDHRRAIEDIAAAVSEQKISSAEKWLEKLFKDIDISISDVDIKPALSPLSYSYLLEMLRKIGNQAHDTDNADETYRFVYAVKFYFTLFFNRLFLLGIEENKENKEKGKFGRLLRASNLETWKPHFENISAIKDTFSPNSIMRFDLNYYVLNEKLKNNKIKLGDVETIDEKIGKNCIIQVSGKNQFAHRGDLHLLMNNFNKDPQNAPLIIYDLGALLLSYVCNVNSDITTEKTSKELIACQNCLFMILLNWDVQRCVEKTEFDTSNENIFNENDISDDKSNSTVLEDDMKFLIDRISKRLNDCLTYLPIKWNLLEAVDGTFTNRIDISLFNLKLSLDYIKASLNTVADVVEKADKEANNQSKLYAYTTSPSLDSCDEAIQRLSFLSDLSMHLKNIIEKWNKLYDFRIKSGENDSKMEKYLEENEEESSKLFNDLKSDIMEKEFKTIKEEVQKVFKNN